MKVLHTSDWHLGHTLYDYDRSAEQKHFLHQLCEIVKQEKPDVMVVSGDIYHNPTPSAAAQKMYTDGLLHIHKANPSMSIVVTAGNHDSSSKLEVNTRLWDVVNVKVIGTFEKIDDQFNLDKHIVEVTDSSDKLVGYVVAVPHSYPNNFPVLREDTTRELRQKHFFQTLLSEVEVRNTDKLPVVLMAHLSATGCDMTGHDETVGGIEYVDVQEFGDGYSYLALGHIHCPQTLKNSDGKARYSGSPIPVSFDENYPHSVTLVTFDQDKVPQIEMRNIENIKPLLTIPREPKELEEVLQQLEHNISDDEEAYIRLNVLVKDYLAPDTKERASEILKNKKAKFCTIKQNFETKLSADDNQKKFTLEDIKKVDPIEIAQRFYQHKYNTEMDDELLDCMKQVIQQINMEEQA